MFGGGRLDFGVILKAVLKRLQKYFVCYKPCSFLQGKFFLDMQKRPKEIFTGG